MSRCFQYPPPGYILSEEKKVALIELIKLQKEKEMKKQKREEKKKKRAEKKKEREKKKKKEEEKKQKEEEKKQKREEKDNVTEKVDNSYLVNCHERMDAETDQSHQSSLTEEHGHPVPSSSHDSTENSNKRKRQSSPDECSHGHDEANLIRQASKGQIVSHTLHTDDCCYTSGRTSSREQICSASEKTGNRLSLNAVMHGVELQYKQLFESCFPPQLHNASLYPDDLDWLYTDRCNQDTQGAEKRQRSGGDSISCSRSSTSWHRAEYLPEINAFALPYVVPY